MRTHFAAAAALLLACVAAQETETSHSDHDHDHDHDSHEDETSHESHEGEHFEAAAVYDVEAGTNSFVVVPAEGSFEDTTFAFMIVPAATADAEGLEEAEEEAETAWDAYLAGAEATVLATGEAAVPDSTVVYEIALVDPLVVVNVDVAAAGANAFFLQHGADEITTALASPAGAVYVAAAEEGAEEEEEEEEDDDEDTTASGSQWANALVASFVVSLCSLAGVIVIINKRVAYNIGLNHAFLFASGALLTASLMHIVPESLEGLNDKYDNLHDTGIYAGLSILGGLSFGLLVHALLDTGHSHDHAPPHAGVPVAGPPSAAVSGVSPDSGLMLAKEKAAGNGDSSSMEVAAPAAGADVDATQPPSPATEATPDNLKTLISSRQGRSLLDLKNLHPVCWNVIAGDLVHNFADGVTIGAAFLSCSTAIGWTVTASAILHEVPHEIADFMALLNGGMSVKQAFAYNFLSALSAVLGTIIILALSGSITNAAISVILLIGAGSFIFIALAELLPEAMSVGHAVGQQGSSAVLWSQVRKLMSFLLGALLIGIPLIFDQHCEADGHDH